MNAKVVPYFYLFLAIAGISILAFLWLTPKPTPSSRPKEEQEVY